jgi:hypothetical protein
MHSATNMWVCLLLGIRLIAHWAERNNRFEADGLLVVVR